MWEEEEEGICCERGEIVTHGLIFSFVQFFILLLLILLTEVIVAVVLFFHESQVRFEV